MTIPENVKKALDLLYAAGFEAYLVGGCVRDFVRGQEPSDYDITTPSTPEETKAVFKDYPVFLQGEKHGTVGVIINGEKLEITTHRQDGDYIDHRRPESVIFSRALADDLSRRDFTVNALAYSSHSGIVDLFGGVGDIQNGVIRCVGDPQRRFDEDALRILRALRFSSTLGFDIEENTVKAIFENKELIKTVSSERIREELEKLVCGKCACDVIDSFRDIFTLILGDFDTNLFCAECSRLENARDKLALLFCATDGECIRHLKFSNEDSAFYKSVRELYLSDAPVSSYELKRSVFIHGEAAVMSALEIKKSPMKNTLEKAICNGECMHRRDMRINGGDLARLGYKQGTEMGRTLDTLFDLVLRDEIPNEQKKLIEYAIKLKETV